MQSCKLTICEAQHTYTLRMRATALIDLLMSPHRWTCHQSSTQLRSWRRRIFHFLGNWRTRRHRPMALCLGRDGRTGPSLAIWQPRPTRSCSSGKSARTRSGNKGKRDSFRSLCWQPGLCNDGVELILTVSQRVLL